VILIIEWQKNTRSFYPMLLYKAYFIVRKDKMINPLFHSTKGERGRHGRDRMVMGFTTNYAISAYHH